MGKRWGGRYRGPKGVGFQGVSEYDGPGNEASLDEAFEEAAAVVQRVVDDPNEPETESLLDTTFDVHIELKARRQNQNVRVYTVIITSG